MIKFFIDKRQLIPVRLIPLITGWSFSPDIVAEIMAGQDPIHRVSIPSFHLDQYGNISELLPKEWDGVVTDLDILSNTLSANEMVDNESYPIWRRESIKLLPEATFVWLDDLETAWNTAFSEDHMHLMDERPGDREINLSPLIPANVSGYIYEGFEPLIVSVTSNSTSKLMYVSFEELLDHLMFDPFYGVETVATETIINEIYRENTGNTVFEAFRRRFSLSPNRSDQQRHLIYLWCGLLGLPTYKDKIPLNWQREDVLDHWSEDFDFQLSDILGFLRRHKWPLPSHFFPDAFDSTERKVVLDQEIFDKTFYDFAVVLPRLEKEREEIQGITPKSMAERQQKIKALDEVNCQIEALHQPEVASDRKQSVKDEKTVCLTTPPNNKTDWFFAIRDCTESFVQQHGRCPNSTEVWIQLRTAPPHQYGISSGVDNGEEAI